MLLIKFSWDFYVFLVCLVIFPYAICSGVFMLKRQVITSEIYFMVFVAHQFNWIKNKLTSFHWFFWITLISWTKWLKKFINNSISIIIRCIFYITLFECITRSSSASFEEIKLIAIVNWIFHASDFWRSIIITLK